MASVWRGVAIGQAVPARLRQSNRKQPDTRPAASARPGTEPDRPTTTRLGYLAFTAYQPVPSARQPAFTKAVSSLGSVV
ncbi:hypothetical protein CQR47_0352 [Bifidobacterium thermophilum]|uniref:Uncharacterized protein n=1 Tax=Bifidobacterium thermophilum TaxID=33905 RepID=A0A2N3QN36_9BIFI|nr:hypothetical protein CQR47_0352 [Bifidobacterium thermophilum]